MGRTVGWTESELFLYGGIALMGAVSVMAVVCIGIFIFTGRRLKKKLEEEYGSPRN